MRDKVGIIGVGFGGMCFPKDTSALQRLSSDMDGDMSLLPAAITKNKMVRKE